MAMIPDAFVSGLAKILIQMTLDKVGELLGVPDEIRRLSRMVDRVQGVLVDAERRQNDEGINGWVMQLKDVMYDADNVIDLCRMKADERRAQSGSSPSSMTSCGIDFLSCFRNPFFAGEIANKIKDLNKRMNDLVSQISLLSLIKDGGVSSEAGQHAFNISRETDSIIALSDLVGQKIEEDTDELVELLTKDVNQGKGEIPIVAIAGMGGIGKTTLAKKVFNDPRIQEEFKHRIWICVSKKLRLVDILRNVITEIGGDCGEAKEISQLMSKLEQQASRKKFLLVLDDIWAESEKVWFGRLRVAMPGGALGSRVLITTRDDGVARGMGAIHTLKVKRLSDEDGWSLLVKQVAIGHKSKIDEIKEIEGIGKKIVEKCDGLPLAIKIISGVLRRKRTNTSEWETVLTNKFWSMEGLPEDLHRAFYLSYEDLSSPLKQCFIFCSLLPEDHRFHRTDLIYLWLAEGFLRGRGDFWKLGNEYYTELLLRNFLEDTEIHYDQEESKMHDILWSFARQLGKDENYVLCEGQTLSMLKSSLKVRRLSIEGNEVNNEVFRNEKGLRTLLLRFKPDIALHDLCETFLSLRILDLNSSNFSNLPDSLCDLVHLRYLDVRDSNIKNLPDSMGKLKNLVYLNLLGCRDLSHIPSSIINLQELNFLSIYESGVKAIPAGLNKLYKLVQLHAFKPDKNSLEGYSSLDELESLSQLISLLLVGLDKVTDRNIAKAANLRNKNQLRDLDLMYTSLRAEEQFSQTDEKKMTAKNVLDELSPPSSLEILKIGSYLGSHLPDWLKFSNALPNLRFIEINNCACFDRLSPLGQLPNLDYLKVIGAYSVKSVGEDFMQGDIESRGPTAHEISCATTTAFPKLTVLCFQNLPNWEEWQWHEGQSAMPKLKELFIRDCPQLGSLPEGLFLHATSLEYLEIDIVDKLITVENLLSIKKIHVSRCPNLITLKNLKSLQRMILIDYEMKILPDYLKTIIPHELRIQCSKDLLVAIINHRESNSEWDKVKHIPKVKICTGDESLYVTYVKEPLSFTTNINTRLAQR